MRDLLSSLRNEPAPIVRSSPRALFAYSALAAIVIGILGAALLIYATGRI